jgi:hypothetical protein
MLFYEETVIGKIVKIVSHRLYFGIEGVLEKTEGYQATVRALVDQPGTGMLVPGTLTIDTPARQLQLASAETQARVVIEKNRCNPWCAINTQAGWNFCKSTRLIMSVCF